MASEANKPAVTGIADGVSSSIIRIAAHIKRSERISICPKSVPQGLGSEMATFEHRGGRWRAKVRVAGSADSGTFGTKAEAKVWAAQRETELRAGQRGAAAVAHTLAAAINRYMREVTPTMRGHDKANVRLKRFARELPFAHERIDRVAPIRWAAWRDQRLLEVKASSVRRELALMSGLYSHAVREWRWLDVNPLKAISKPQAPKARTRLVLDREVDQLLLAVGYERGKVPETRQQQVGWSLLFALETAMRAGEICGLLRDDVDLADAVATLPITKNGDARTVPLSRAAVALLDLAMKLPAAADGRVLLLKKGSLCTLFRKATARCGISGLTFHDSRATALTRLARNLQIDVLTLAKISGHRDINMLSNTYYREQARDIAKRLG